jgi:hypothetical protein
VEGIEDEDRFAEDEDEDEDETMRQLCVAEPGNRSCEQASDALGEGPDI